MAVQIMRDMHEQRSHRDIKPANIMISWQGGQVDVMLVDFAGSRLHSEGKEGLGCNQYTDQLCEHCGINNAMDSPFGMLGMAQCAKRDWPCLVDHVCPSVCPVYLPANCIGLPVFVPVTP